VERKILVLQALLAGNLINLGMILAFIADRDETGITLILVSWAAAYLGAFYAVSSKIWYSDGTVIPLSVSGCRRAISWSLDLLCIGTSVTGFIRTMYQIFYLG